MYCVMCGVQLADTEQHCPLCGTVPFHPELHREPAAPLYPEGRKMPPQVSPKGALVVVSAMFLLPMLITLLCDLQVNGTVRWSGYVIGALLLAYTVFVLPVWFRRPEPVSFAAGDLAATALYLLYISLKTEGGWFLSFAFPSVGAIGAIILTVTALLRYVRRGKLYIFGGAFLALGLCMPLLEYRIVATFDRPEFVAWSLYPLVILMLFGGMLIFLAICRPARETMERKFFI